MLAAARRYRCRTLIASTSEVYGKGVKVPFAEDDDLLLGPSSRSRWCYAASKLLDEFLGLAAHREYGLPVTIVRFFNTVGPGQTGRYGMVVPAFRTCQPCTASPFTVYGDGDRRALLLPRAGLGRRAVVRCSTGRHYTPAKSTISAAATR